MSGKMSDDRHVNLGDFWYNESEYLGSGAFGEVYKGHSHKEKNELFAVKKIRIGNIDKREIQILHDLSAPGVRHSNLVKLMDYMVLGDGAYVYLVMEYCNGGDLAGYLKEKKTMNEPSLKIFLQQIASGLKVLYDHKVIHRDLKPENILLSHSGGREIKDITFKIADFGLGRYLDTGYLAGTICGTPVFMAPEIFDRNARYDYKVDLWSVGVIVFECHTGKLPHDKPPGIPGLVNLFEQVPIRYPENIALGLKDLLMKLLRVRPKERISFNEFYEHPFIGIGEISKDQIDGNIPISAPAVLSKSVEPEYRPHPRETYTRVITTKPPEALKIPQIQGKESDVRKHPSIAKPKPFKDASVFKYVDAHGLEVSKSDHSSFQNLIWHLIYAREITNELDKARALFMWLCCKDLTKLNFGNVQKDSPEEALINLQQRRTTYAEVFAILCGFAGLHCNAISGYAKGTNFKIGKKFEGDESKHSWNTVLIDGIWRLVDCTWAARKVVEKGATAKNITYEVNEYFFIPDPQQFIFTHFPDDFKWQLLESPITLTDFENLAFVSSTFFKLGLEIVSHRKGVIHAKQEELIRIGCSQSKAHSVAFTFTLTYEDGKEQFKDIQLDRFAMQEVVENESLFTIRLPEKGTYRLVIYAKLNDPLVDQGKYVNVCEYKMFCDVNPARPSPFPPVSQISWGPRDIAIKYNLIPLQQRSIVNTANGLAVIKIQTPKELVFAAKLKSNDRDEKDLDGYVMQRMVGDLAVFTVRSPSKGEFGLEIWVSDPQKDGNSLHHAYQYLIICNEYINPETVVKLPGLSSRYLGPQPTFKKFGLSTMSYSDPFIETAVGEIKVVFKVSQPMRMTSRLLYATGNSDDDASQYVLHQNKGDTITLSLRFPKAGFYKFQIYSLPKSDESENLLSVYNYLISCTNKQVSSVIQFPEQSGNWKDGCYLHEPLDGQLQRHRSASTLQNVFFKVEVPKAKSVAVVVEDKEWTQLDQKPHGLWEGAVNMEKHWGHVSKVAVCAKYGDAKDSYSVLLKYSV